MLYYKVTFRASLKVLETYFKIIDMFKIKVVVLLSLPLYTFTGLNLKPYTNTYLFLWLQSRKSFAVARVSCLFKVVICNCM